MPPREGEVGMQGGSRPFPTVLLWMVPSNAHKDGCAPRGPSSV